MCSPRPRPWPRGLPSPWTPPPRSPLPGRGSCVLFVTRARQCQAVRALPSSRPAVFFPPQELLLSGALSLGEKAPCVTSPLSELETTGSQHQCSRGACCMGKGLFMFMGRMFRKCSCNGSLAGGTRPSCEMCGFSFEGKEPQGDRVILTSGQRPVSSTTCPRPMFLQRPWDTGKKRSSVRATHQDAAIVTVS